MLGILTGLFLASRFDVVLTVTTLLGSIYMNALNMMIFPLVFCSIVVGITSIGNAKTTEKITGGAMIFFLFTTALASFVGLIIPRAINLGKGVRFEMATSDIEASKMTSILDTVKNLIPANPVAAFANGNMLQVLTFAVIIGFTLVAIGEKGEPLLKVIESGNEVCLKIISTVMYFTPIGVFCTIVPVVEANGTETWACAGSYRGSMLASCIQNQIVDALDTTDRGVKIATPGVNGLYVLTNTDMPAVLVELAFITNPDDEDILANAQDALARAVARGVTDYEQLILGGK